MAYGTLKCDNITFTNGGIDQTVTVSGIVQSISGNITATGTIQGQTIIGTSTVSGATVTGNVGVFTTVTGGSAGFTTVTGTTVIGTTANFVNGTFSTQVSGTTVRGTTVSGATVTGAIGQFTTLTGGTAGFTTVTGATVTGTTANFQSGVFTTQISGATVTGDVGSFSTITGGTVTLTSGVFGTGTAAAPSIAFTGDSNTGIYSPGADQVAVATNGTGRLFVDASGNVGIGATPNSYAGYSTLTINNTTGSELDFEVNGTLTSDIYTDSAGTYWTTRTAVPIVLRTNSTERLRITSAGLVGIGTSSPASTLHVAGTFRNTGQTYLGIGEATTLAYIGDPFTTNTRSILFNRASGVTDIVNIQGINVGVALTDIALQAGGGRVGIGTTSPGSALEVKAAAPVLTVNSAVANASSIVLQENGTTYARFRFDGNNVDIGNLYVNGATIFNAGNAERARIDSSGRLLVGTSTARGNFYGAYTSRAQIEGVDFETAALNITCNNATDINSGVISLNKSGGATVGSNTIVSSGERLGSIRFQGNDGTNFIEAAYVLAEVDGTPGPNDMPGRLVFSTTADGASSPTERFRVTADGSIYFHSTSLPGAGTATTGVGISAGDALSVQRAAATACFFGRSDDGEVVALYSGTTQRGTISIAGATTTYGSISDHRLKENVAPIGNATSRLAQLKPSRFNFVEFPEQEVDGFIAHEVQAIVPEAVIGTKDATDKNGKPLIKKRVVPFSSMPDFRALCVELLESLESEGYAHWTYPPSEDELIQRVRAALAETGAIAALDDLYANNNEGMKRLADS
jgi:uncharacterized protein YjbI with pentapeptide repeats